MGDIFLNGQPLSEMPAETIESLEHEKARSQMDARKFTQMHGHIEVHLTACAVSKMAKVDLLPEVPEYADYFIEPNAQWVKDSSHERAWVKVYHSIDRQTTSVIKGRIQTITIPMPFLGESREECWGELQILLKRKTIRGGRQQTLELVKFGRQRSYDSRVGQWVSETKTIEPKMDGGTHAYISLRLYHQDHRPETPADWRFEPLYVSVAGEDFYRIDAVWQDESIVITATLLDDDSEELPKFLRR